MQSEFSKPHTQGTPNTSESRPAQAFGGIDSALPGHFQNSTELRGGGGGAAPQWDWLQAEYHARKLALWEAGITGDRFTQECRAIRAELGITSQDEARAASLDCPRCGPVAYTTRPRGPHTQALCKSCGRHIKFLSKDSFDWDAMALETETLPFGVHRGKTFKQIAKEDPGYIRYLAGNSGRKFRDLADLAIEEYGL